MTQGNELLARDPSLCSCKRCHEDQEAQARHTLKQVAEWIDGNWHNRSPGSVVTDIVKYLEAQLLAPDANRD